MSVTRSKSKAPNRPTDPDPGNASNRISGQSSGEGEGGLSGVVRLTIEAGIRRLLEKLARTLLPNETWSKVEIPQTQLATLISHVMSELAEEHPDYRAEDALQEVLRGLEESDGNARAEDNRRIITLSKELAERLEVGRNQGTDELTRNHGSDPEEPPHSSKRKRREADSEDLSSSRSDASSLEEVPPQPGRLTRSLNRPDVAGFEEVPPQSGQPTRCLNFPDVGGSEEVPPRSGRSTRSLSRPHVSGPEEVPPQ